MPAQRQSSLRKAILVGFIAAAAVLAAAAARGELLPGFL